MKLKTLIVAGALALAAAHISGLAFAKNVEKIQSFKRILSKIAIAERPAKVAALVAAALPADKKETMESLVEAISQINPTALPAVVGAIATTSPELAPATRDFATTLAPAQADSFKLATQESSLTSKSSASVSTEAIALLGARSLAPYANPNPTARTNTFVTNTIVTQPGALVGQDYSRTQ